MLLALLLGSVSIPGIPSVPPPLQPSVLIASASIVCGKLQAYVINYNEQTIRLPEASQFGVRLTTASRRQFVHLVSSEPNRIIESGSFRRSIYIGVLDDPRPGNGSLDDGTGWHIDVVDTGFCPETK